MKEINISKKIIGVIGRPAVDDENDKLIAIYEDTRTAIIKKNCIPFIITPFSTIDYVDTIKVDVPKLDEKEKEALREMVDLCDGIIIPGGYKWFDYDEYIIDYAIDKDIPVLGICLGMQILACMDNNERVLEENTTVIEHKQREVKYVHNIEIVDNTILSSIINSRIISVNSKHRYHVVKVNNFIVSAYSEDGLIEAIELPTKKCVIGVQWHPEKMLDYDFNANKILDYFVNKC